MAKKGRKIKRKVALLLIILLLLHIFLTYSRYTTKEEKYVDKTFPIVTTDYEIASKEECDEVPYEYGYKWEGWQETGNDEISPNFRLINYERANGSFIVDFAFFDDSIYNFDKFEGKKYEEVRDILPWDAASMHAMGFEVDLNPLETKLINPRVKKIDPNKVYWVHVVVYPPNYVNCSTIYYQKEINHTDIRSEKVKVINTKTKTLWEIVLNYFKSLT